MKRLLISSAPHLFMVLSLLFVPFSPHAQESDATSNTKNVFVEFLGSGAAVVSVNFDMRLNKGRDDGLGVRLGVGVGSVTTDHWLLEEGSVKTKLITIPLEVNYILGKNKFAFEIGGAVTYVNVTEDSNYEFLGEQYEDFENGNVLVAYIPVGFRLRTTKNIMLKLNVGPLWNFSAPNLYAENEVYFFGGLAVGYSFR